MMEKKIICLIGDTRHDAPDAANVLSNLVRVCTLELGKLCRALDLEEHLFSPGRDDLKLWHRRFSVTSPIASLIKDTRTFTLIVSPP